jgi:hypothetical protein
VRRGGTILLGWAMLPNSRISGRARLPNDLTILTKLLTW